MIRFLFVVPLLSACNSGTDTGEMAVPLKTKLEVSLVDSVVRVADPSLIDPAGETVSSRIHPPSGFQRVIYQPGTFGHYLQNFPLKAVDSKVFLFDGREKYRQDVHVAVLDIDVGKRDLQQCADAVMRLRAEYLWKEQRYQDIRFNFTNGFPAPYARWRSGERIQVQGNAVNWVKRNAASESYEDFRRYLVMVFSYAGTLSLAGELESKDISAIEAGDVFIQGGSPGHAVIVLDKAIDESSGEILVLLAQSYMPAQDIHILQNFNNSQITPWYSVDSFSAGVDTPEWRFTKGDLKKF